MGFFSGITNAISNVVKGIGNVVSSVVKGVVNVVSSVINFVASPFMGLLGGVPDMPDAGSQAQAQQGVLLQRQGSNESIPVIYGLRKVGGIVTFAETGSDNNKYLWVAYAFAEGCVEGLHELFIDDFQFSADTVGKLNGGNIVDVTDGKYNGRCQLQWFPGQLFVGSPQGVVSGSSICKSAPSWKSSMDYNGLAVLFARYEWKKIETQADSEANPYSGNIPKIQATILGRKIVSLVTTAITNYNSTYLDDFNSTLRYSKFVSAIELSKIESPIVITNGCFDIVHEGHIALFKFCKSISRTNGSVVVALNSDESIKRLKGSDRPINNLQARIALLNEIESIDMIVVFNEDTPYELYKVIKPTTLVKGGDYQADTLIGREFCTDVKIFNYIEGKSTTNIINNIKTK
jgi:rfaE bifunctional protein nucleotidyltransferase chain/domain